MRKHIAKNITRYMREIFPQKKEHMENLAVFGQNPHTVLITCSDSRVLAEQILGNKPGEVFYIRNPGNFIPKEGMGSFSERAALCFALSNFDIKSIIVMGHSDCGAMKAICYGYRGCSGELISWLRLAEIMEVKDDYGFGDKISAIDKVCLLNVVQQKNNLMKDILLKKAKNFSNIKINACFFQISYGQVYFYNSDLNRFELFSK